MDPKPGQLVNILFRSGIKEKGYVIEWSDQKSAIKSEHNEDILIILQTLNDVLAVQIIHAGEEKQIEQKEIAPITDHEIKKKSLVELYKEKNKIEKEEVKKKVFSLDNTGVQNVEYGYPSKISLPTKFVKK